MDWLIYQFSKSSLNLFSVICVLIIQEVCSEIISFPEHVFSFVEDIDIANGNGSARTKQGKP